MIRLISSLSKQSQSAKTTVRNLQQSTQAAFTAAKKNDEADLPEEEVSITSAVDEDDKGASNSQSNNNNNNNNNNYRSRGNTGEEGGERRPFNRRQSGNSSGQSFSNPRILRSSQEAAENYVPVNFGVTKDEASAYFTSQLQNLDKHMPLNIFSCLNLSEQQEKAMRYLLQDDEQRNIRGKISSIFKRISEVGSATEEIVKQVEGLLSTAFYKEQVFIISDRDFKSLIFMKEFQRVIPLFYSKRFFQANSSYLTQIEVAQILKKCRSEVEFYPLLELLKFHKNFQTKNPMQQQKFTSAEKDLALQFLFDIRGENNTKLNYLLAFFIGHHLLRINLSTSFETGEISKHFSRIHFGNSDERSKREFQSRLHELLNMKIKLGISSALQHYMCDNFFSFDSYDHAITSIALHILILARLAEGHNNLSDLFTQYSQTFGQHKFDFYINEHLPQVLQTLQNKSMVNNLTDALKLFTSGKSGQSAQNHQQSNSKSANTVEFQKLTFFDHAFTVKNGSIFLNYDLANQTENVSYRWEQANLLNLDRSSVMNAKQFAFQDAYLNNNREAIVENLLKEATLNSEITTAAKKKQKELEELKKTNPKEYYNQMFIFIYNALDEVYTTQEESVANYFKGRNIMTPTKSFVASSSLRPMFSTIKQSFSSSNKVSDLEDDIDSANATTSATGEAQAVKSTKSFSDFMAKVREIDRNTEKNNPFLTKDDIQNIKGLQVSEGGNAKNGKIANAPADAETTQAEPATKNVEITLPTTKASNVTFYTEFFGSTTDENEALIRIEKEIYDQRANLHSFVNGLAALPENFVGQLPEGKYLLFKAFSAPQLYVKQENLANLMSKVDLSDSRSVVKCRTLRLGDISRDYKDYLSETVFGSALEHPGYNAILDICKLHYKRRLFKRILAHIVINRAKLDKSTVERIIEISKSARIGVTLFEFTYLLANDPKSNLTQPIFVQLLNSLKNFEDVHEDIETLVKVYLNADLTRTFDNSILESYINSLVRAKSMNKLMTMLERLRDFFLARKVPYLNELSADVNNSKQEEFKLQNRSIVQSLFRIYMQKLTSAGLNTFARPLFQELTNMKFSLNEDDFIQGFKSMIDSPEDVELLYEQAMHDKLNFGIELIRCLLEVFKKHPKPLAQLTIRILKEQVYTEKIPIEVMEINDFVVLFTRNEIPAEYSDLLKYLIKYPHKVNDFTKANSFKVVNSITEEMLRSFLKGQIDQVFASKKQEVLRSQLLSERSKKRSAKKDEPAYQTATQGAQKKKQKGGNKDAAKGDVQATPAEATPSTNNAPTASQQQTITQQPATQEAPKGISDEEINEVLLQGLDKKNVFQVKSKRKVLNKAGVSKFKDIEAYIKGLKTSKDEGAASPAAKK